MPTLEEINQQIAALFGYNQQFVDRLNGNVEKVIARRLKQSLTNVQQQLANMYAEYGDSVTLAEMNKFNRLASLEAAITDELKTMGVDVKKQTDNGILDSYRESYYGSGYALENGVGVRMGFTEIPVDAIRAALINPYDKIGWLNRETGHIADLTVKIRSAVTEGLAQGYGYKKTKQIFANKFAGATSNLVRIIQTETHRAQEIGNLVATDKAKSAAERLGLKLQRIWQATLDLKTRDQHARLDGQPEDENGNFTIDGYSGKAPGNFGVAELDINCRCTTITLLDNETPKFRLDNVDKKRIPYQTYEEWAKSKNLKVHPKRPKQPKAGGFVPAKTIQDAKDWCDNNDIKYYIDNDVSGNDALFILNQHKEAYYKIKNSGITINNIGEKYISVNKIPLQDGLVANPTGISKDGKLIRGTAIYTDTIEQKLKVMQYDINEKLAGKKPCWIDPSYSGTLTHECGHHVRNLLDDKFQKEINDYFFNNEWLYDDLTPSPSLYGIDDISEFYAECFSAICIGDKSGATLFYKDILKRAGILK